MPPPVTYDSNEAGTIDLVLNMIADSATWRGLMTPAATSNAEGRARIIESDGGEDPTMGEATYNCLGASITLAAPLCVVYSSEWPAEERGIGMERRQGVFVARFFLAPVSGDKPAEHFRRAINYGGAIRSEIKARFKTSASYLMAGSVALEGPFAADSARRWKNTMIVDLKITWRA